MLYSPLPRTGWSGPHIFLSEWHSFSIPHHHSSISHAFHCLHAPTHTDPHLAGFLKGLNTFYSRRPLCSALPSSHLSTSFVSLARGTLSISRGPLQAVTDITPGVSPTGVLEEGIGAPFSLCSKQNPALDCLACPAHFQPRSVNLFLLCRLDRRGGRELAPLTDIGRIKMVEAHRRYSSVTARSWEVRF